MKVTPNSTPHYPHRPCMAPQLKQQQGKQLQGKVRWSKQQRGNKALDFHPCLKTGAPYLLCPRTSQLRSTPLTSSTTLAHTNNTTLAHTSRTLLAHSITLAQITALPHTNITTLTHSDTLARAMSTMLALHRPLPQIPPRLRITPISMSRLLPHPCPMPCTHSPRHQPPRSSMLRACHTTSTPAHHSPSQPPYHLLPTLQPLHPWQRLLHFKPQHCHHHRHHHLRR
mmetsp:Transcript_6099/g.16237  ORF Transcript_6099/g.16237 Transcript_6099/m.16237 type:complete len:226 (-) Transcript_6099:422-1099(-)